MRQVKSIFLILIILLGVTSCSMNLDDLAYSDEAELLGFKFETRKVEVRTIYVTINGEQKSIEEEYVVFESAHDLDDVEINNETHEVIVTISNPDVDITNIVGIASISPGAQITPVNNSPRLGSVGDFSVEREYKIKSASGNNETYWKIKVNK